VKSTLWSSSHALQSPFLRQVFSLKHTQLFIQRNSKLICVMLLINRQKVSPSSVLEHHIWNTQSNPWLRF
jgi:hypothetical protein